MTRDEAAKVITENISILTLAISAHARHWAARYNGRVYLIGSTLHSPTPRDVDVRIIVEDHEFAARYGHLLVRKEKPFHERPEIVEANVVDFCTDGPTQRWIDDVAKFSGRLSRELGRNMDIQIWPESQWRAPYPPPILLAAPSPRWFFYESEAARPVANIE
jgi:hypothetical protein